MNLRKVLIPAAGRGTRFLPATKAVPKEMLPVLNKPLIQYSVEESVAAGFDHVVLVTTKGKESIDNHFRPAPELERALEEAHKEGQLDEVRQLGELVSLAAVHQQQPRGVGDAVLVGRELVGEEPFAVIFPDDFIVSEVPVLRQLREVYEEMSGLVIAVEKMPRKDIGRYGVIRGEAVRDGLYRVEDLVEKPGVDEAPSNLAIVGRYILEPVLFDILADTTPGFGGEIQLTDALRRALADLPCHALVFEGQRYDCGSKLGFLEATVAVALRDHETGSGFRDFLGALLRGATVL